MVGFLSDCKNISVFSLYGNREKFSAQTTGLLFRNNHKMPRKKMLTCDLFKKDVKNVIHPFHAFRDCKGIFTIKLPEGLQTVGSAAFYGCENFRRITLPNSVTRIGPFREISLPKHISKNVSRSELPVTCKITWRN